MLLAMDARSQLERELNDKKLRQPCDRFDIIAHSGIIKYIAFHTRVPPHSFWPAVDLDE